MCSCKGESSPHAWYKSVFSLKIADCSGCSISLSSPFFTLVHVEEHVNALSTSNYTNVAAAVARLYYW